MISSARSRIISNKWLSLFEWRFYRYSTLVGTKFPKNSTSQPNRYLPSVEFKASANTIDGLKSAPQVLEFISTSCPQNTQLWGQSIQKCVRMEDIDSAIAIINVMYNENIKRSAKTYNNLFAGLIKSHYGIDECFKYLDKMINEDNIQPNSVICGTLSRGIRIENDEVNIDIHKLKQIEKLIKTYAIQPDVLCYSELIRIYIKCYKLKKAYVLWKDMYKTYVLSLNNDFNNIQNKPYWKPFMSATTDVVNGFASNAGKNDINKMMKIWKLLSKPLNFYGDRIIYGCLMKGLLNDYEYNNKTEYNNHLSLILMLWREMLLKNIQPDYKNFHCISRCYLKIIENVISSNNFDQESENQIKICLNKLMDDIPKERVKYGLKKNDHILAGYQFKAYLLLYYDNDINKVKKLFDSLKNDNKIGIFVMQQSDDNVMIDLSECIYQQEIAFSLRYLLDNYNDMLIEKDLLIMLGKISDENDSLQTRYHKRKIENIHRLNEYLFNVLNTWDSGINIIKINDNIVKITAKDVKKLQNT